MESEIKNLIIYLIKSSRYDDDGYVVRHFKGVLPSNTLACMYGLTEDVRKSNVLGSNLKWDVRLIDEAVQKVDVKKILQSGKKKNTKVIACLVGIQSNQFPRAYDVALELKQGGLDVLIGGFHVSGSIAMLPKIPDEIQKLTDAGITVVAGEIEGKWEGILRDSLQGNLKPIYNYLLELPNLNNAPMSKISKGYLKHFAFPNFGTLDCGRGCPFSCSFCTVINVQGRAMRYKGVERIMDLLRENYSRHKITFYFFTDDNFCRNKNWEAIFDSLIKLREEEKIPIEFMMQVDTQSYKIKNFVTKASLAGCKQVFIGLESLSAENLAAAGKKQNKLSEFSELISSYRQVKINTHTGYIIGFPADTLESIREDVRRLKEELGPEQASFFILTPLPGSEDHLKLLQKGVSMDPDLNNYDSFHVTTAHPNMTKEQWMQAYKEAWESFYSIDNMKAILKRVSKENYWGVFRNIVWYKNAVFVEGGHPMIEGFVRVKDRCQRRPGYKVEPVWQHFKRRFFDMTGYAQRWMKLALEMEELWLHTRQRSALEEQIVEVLNDRYKNMKEWRDVKLAELQEIYCHSILTLQNAYPNTKLKKLPSRFLLWLKQRNIFLPSLTYSRMPFQDFWRKTGKYLSHGYIHKINLTRIISTAIQESILFVTFWVVFFSKLLPSVFSKTLKTEKAT